MEKIEHAYHEIRGLRLHVAQVGTGESGDVVFLHGFPEIWYSWRHQMLAVAAAGFRAVAPDFRGYGLSEQPADIATASWEDLTADLVAIFDALTIEKAFVVAKDFGAGVAYQFALLHKDRVLGVAGLGVPFSPQSTSFDAFPKGFYVLRWREPGRAEADFGRLPVKTVVRNIYILFTGSEIPVAPSDDLEIMDLVDPTVPLPPWFGDDDLAAYTALYENSGFLFPLQLPYRAKRVVETAAAAEGVVRLEVPALLIMGEKDYILKFPGMEDYVRSGKVNYFAPQLQVIFVSDGSHFVQEQFPGEVNRILIDFFLNNRTGLNVKRTGPNV